MQVLVDTADKCVIAVYPDEADEIKSKCGCHSSNKIVLYSHIISEIMEQLLKTKFMRLKGKSFKKYPFAFHEFSDVLIAAVYSDKRNCIFFDEAVWYRDKALKIYKALERHYYSLSLENIAFFVKVRNAEIDYVYRYRNRFYFNLRGFVNKPVISEFMLKKSKVVRCVLEEYGEPIIKNNASRILKEFY